MDWKITWKLEIKNIQSSNQSRLYANMQNLHMAGYQKSQRRSSSAGRPFYNKVDSLMLGL